MFVLMLLGDEMQKVLQDYGMFWMFGSFSLVWTALVFLIVPEFGVVVQNMMNAVYVMEIIQHVLIVQVLLMVVRILINVIAALQILIQIVFKIV